MCAAKAPDRKRIAVIGGGWAGCAAAVELARLGHQVKLFEAARTLGGRARCVEMEGTILDNGQHILLGAYSETLRLLRLIGIRPEQAMLRLPLQMRHPQGSGGMEFVAPRLPAPFHMLAGLLRARGLATQDRLALARFMSTARWMGWQLHDDCSVSELLDRFDQTDRLVQLMWRPLCIAALNTPPERASAKVFLNVLRDSLGGRRAASDMLIPRVDLTSLFPTDARAFIEAHGGSVQTGAAVKEMRKRDDRWEISAADTEDECDGFDGIVIATPPAAAATLLREWIDVSPLEALTYEPISTCYLQYGPDVGLPEPFFALLDDPSAGEWGQFVFDRAQLDPKQAGLLSVVISASSEAIACGHDALATAVAAQLAKVFRQPRLMHPQWTKVISEKRATFSCAPALVRPGTSIGIDNLALAGDYTASDYPATLESAVRSGVQAARSLVS
ncbi:hydroxysqualene dehydroxylase HpnE [Noviherbaspirillum massiliense]|uniref:hydroxysqualene dehydroxylase HpnE n=1 Tax=Noviherbaspirillum massiliense TaxID=1465823 RepID=UPI00031C6C85|nr:hydroxysqualene dehydroxylase HpnE [Noviherbaspirillum massiliense]